jgi:hypothetical protein
MRRMKSNHETHETHEIRKEATQPTKKDGTAKYEIRRKAREFAGLLYNKPRYEWFDDQ